MCFSNLVGPLEEIGFYGHPLAFLAPSSYGQPHVSCQNLLLFYACYHFEERAEVQNKAKGLILAPMPVKFMTEVS